MTRTTDRQTVIKNNAIPNKKCAPPLRHLCSTLGCATLRRLKGVARVAHRRKVARRWRTRPHATPFGVSRLTGGAARWRMEAGR